jgi:hypothetical protein
MIQTAGDSYWLAGNGVSGTCDPLIILNIDAVMYSKYVHSNSLPFVSFGSPEIIRAHLHTSLPIKPIVGNIPPFQWFTKLLALNLILSFSNVLVANVLAAHHRLLPPLRYTRLDTSNQPLGVRCKSCIKYSDDSEAGQHFQIV